MERDRSNDPYAPGKEAGEDVGPDSRTIMRFGTAAMAAIIIVTGLGLAVSVFGVIRDIIESPDTFVANLDGWTNPKTDQAPDPAAAPPADQAPAGTAEPAQEPPSPGEAAETTPEPTPPPTETVPADANAGPSPTRSPQDMRRAFDSRRRAAGGPEPNLAVPENKDAKNYFEEVLDLIRQGGMGRIIGAIFMLLFAMILAHIPILLIRVGVQLLAATAKIKVPAAD